MKELSQEYCIRLSEMSGDSGELIRVPDLDCANYLALIKVNKASGVQVYYFIDNKEILTSIDVKVLFSKLSRRIIKMGSGQERDVKFMARLFLLVYKGRKALVVEKPEECTLLKPGRIAADQFSSPSLKTDKEKIIYNFWTYEISKNLISHWKLTINRNGSFQYTVKEFPPPGDWE